MSGAATLRSIFERSGYVRLPNLDKKRQFKRGYRKGWEVRLVLRDKQELQTARKGLKEVGLTPGRPFAKHSRIVLPLYGEDAVRWFRPNGPKLDKPKRRRGIRDAP